MKKPLEIFKRLKKQFPNAHCELDHQSPFQLLIATILSAQCTDVRVNMVTPALFKKYPGPKELGEAKVEDVEEIIRSTGFFKNKAANIVKCSQKILELHAGVVPPELEKMVELPGVGRKTANVVLGNAFGITSGVVVDTHVKRISHLLGLTKHTDPEKIERDLMEEFPKKNWVELSHLFIFLGRRVCVARRPACELCTLSDLCPSAKS